MEKEESIRLEIPECYKMDKNGLCIGEFSNDYWSYKKCRYCSLFQVEWCGNCIWMRWHGPHMACHNPEVFKNERGKWIDRSDVAWITRKKDVIYNSRHGCERYKRR